MTQEIVNTYNPLKWQTESISKSTICLFGQLNQASDQWLVES